MDNKKLQWLIFTVAAGLIPIICRALVHFLCKNDIVEFITAGDFVIFGIVLHVSNINEITNPDECDESWKLIQIGTSILFIIIYSLIYSLIVLSEAMPQFIDKSAIEISSIILSFVSFILSLSIYNRRTSLSQQESK
jgi:hypothetical protein